ncbi:MAG: hypothetical protein C0506_03990 [Anaerolinea sp.]|nr:hypothetical protein [Anaerolinea sp.]
MQEQPILPATTREDLLRRAWYIHDAAWFAAVREAYGMEAANRLNQKAVQVVARAESARLGRVTGFQPGDLGELLRLIETGRELYVGQDLMEMKTTQLAPDRYEASVSRCFVAEHIVKAGMATDYKCAVFDRVQGWHQGLRMPLAEGQVPRTTCLIARGEECRREFQLKTEQPP